MKQKELAIALKQFLKQQMAELRQVVLTPTFDLDLMVFPRSTPSAAIRGLGVGIEPGKGQRLLRYRFGVALFERFSGSGEPDAEAALALTDRAAAAFRPDSFSTQGVALTHVTEVGEMESVAVGDDRFVFQAFVVEMVSVEVM